MTQTEIQDLQDQQRDYAEESYWRHYCPEHDASHLTGDRRCPTGER